MRWLILVLALTGCESTKKTLHQAVVDAKEPKTVSEICLDGHVYYEVMSLAYALNYVESIAIKVDDDGKPVKCK